MKTPVPESLFNKVLGLRPAILLKKRPWYKCFKNTFFTEHLRTTASDVNKNHKIKSVNYFLVEKVGKETFLSLSNIYFHEIRKFSVSSQGNTLCIIILGKMYNF